MQANQRLKWRFTPRYVRRRQQIETGNLELMTLKITRVIVALLVVSMFISCTASQHAGVTTIIEPPLSENNQSAWFLYYQDQFDAFKGNVMSPSNQYPEPAHQGYEQAKDEWNKKVSQAKGKTTLLFICGGVGVGVGALFVLSTMFARDTKPL